MPANALRTCLFALALLPCSAGFGESAGATYAVPKHTIDGGGGRSTGAAYEVAGTAGQPDAQGGATGVAFELRGGFWTALPERPDALFSNGFE